MKPFPPELLAAYPRNTLVSLIPERPWWAFEGDHYVRRMGGDVWAKVDNKGHAARIDAEHPLTFPGVRVGQVWAHIELPRKPLGVFTITEFRLGMYRVGGVWCNEKDAVGMCADAFLLADPACPHLAPWAPAAGVP